MAYTSDFIPIPILEDGPYSMRPNEAETFLYFTGNVAADPTTVRIYEVQTSDNTLTRSLILADTGPNIIAQITVPYSDSSRIFVVAQGNASGYKVYTISLATFTVSATSSVITTPFSQGAGLRPAVACSENGTWVVGTTTDDGLFGTKMFLLNTSSGFIFNNFVTTFGITIVDAGGLTGYVIVGSTLYIVGFFAGKMYKCSLVDGNPPVITLLSTFTPGDASLIDAITYRPADTALLLWYRNGDVVVWDVGSDTVSDTFTKTTTAFSDQMPINLEDKNNSTNRTQFMNILTDGSTYDTFNVFDVTDGSNTPYLLTLWQPDPFGGPAADQRGLGCVYVPSLSAFFVTDIIRASTEEEAQVFYFSSSAAAKTYNRVWG